MIACPDCGFEAASDFAFCPGCGTKLPAPRAIREERKVVTSLFCDLVAFTAMSEAADPEDVDAVLRQYHAAARKVIESHGGTVEKFIGDAVVGVFGVPAAHEDDPERAVRAALRLLESMEGMTRPDGSPLEVRCGVNTGEALVRLDVTPGSGAGFLTGDAVNVAARLQAAAPPMGVVVGRATLSATEKAFIYEAREPATVKGKREPLEVWLAKRPVARTAAPTLDGATRFVGRSVELSYLIALLEKASDSSSPQVALIVGEPGIGKSRLVHELFARVDASPRLFTWRQGRCLSYGEGVTFWALAEIVKAHAGILDTDNRDTVEAKLEQVLPEGEDLPWFRQRLRALLGLDAPKAEREENFTAWLRFLEDLALGRPTVLVLEDLHWAEDALLDFLEFFALHVTHVPLMIVATARRELFERHPSFAGAVRVNRIALEPLSQDETEELVASVLDESAADLGASIARQAQGNPFYAEESARLVKDRAGEHPDTSPLADSIQAIIAARLDALAPELKAVLSDASVVGDVFWDGLLAALGGRTQQEAALALDELTARQLVYRVRSSSMAGEGEYAFGHALAREVAYGQLPRLARAKKHAAVAAWIEDKVGESADELAEILAHHYLTALDRAKASGDKDLAKSLHEPAIHYLTLAGSRALILDVQAAERHYSRALDLAGPSSEDRPELLLGWARALSFTGRSRESRAVFEKAVEGFQAAGRPREAAVAMCRLGHVLETLGEPVNDTIQAALGLLADDGPSPELALVLARDVGRSFVTDSRTPEEIIEAVDRIVAMCKELGLPEPAMALHFRGGARMELGDRDGLEDVEVALVAAKAQGLAEELMVIQYNQAAWSMGFRGAAASLALSLEGRDMALRRGDQTNAPSFRATSIMGRYFTGDWDEALDEAPAVDAELEAADDKFNLFLLRVAVVAMLAARGETDAATVFIEWLSSEGRTNEMQWVQAYALVAAAVVNLNLGQCQAAREQLGELTSRSVVNYAEFLPSAVRTALSAGDVDLATAVVQDISPSSPFREHARVTCRALLAEARGEHDEAAAGFADAAGRWHDFGVPYEEAQALLGQGRCLLTLGRAPEARAPLAAAREIFARLGARPALAETDAVLARDAQ